MAHFRGTIQGTQGEASRLGTKETGLRLRAQPWEGYDLVITVRHVPPGEAGDYDRREGEGFDLAELTLVDRDTGARREAGAFNLTRGERI